MTVKTWIPGCVKLVESEFNICDFSTLTVSCSVDLRFHESYGFETSRHDHSSFHFSFIRALEGSRPLGEGACLLWSDRHFVLELKTQLEGNNGRTLFDLDELTRVDASVVRFLRGCQGSGIELLNCPPYIREWMKRDKAEG